jgi:hypothetical protein
MDPKSVRITLPEAKASARAGGAGLGRTPPYGSYIPNTPIPEISIIFAAAGHFLPFLFFFSPIPLTFAALIL